jgi:membrane-associated phospholipid phosphatase
MNESEGHIVVGSVAHIGSSPGSAPLGLSGPGIDGGWYRDVTDFARHTPWLHPIMTAYTTLGILALCALVTLAWWIARRGDLAAMAAVAWTGCATVIAIAASAALKQAFTETRPCLAIAHVTTVQPCPGPTDYSFPSNHTTIAVALAVGVWLVNRRLGVIAVIAALTEGFSRIYLGQHYPHDVAAGLALAALIVLAGWPLARRPLTWLLQLLVGTPLRPLITTTAPPDAAALPGVTTTPASVGTSSSQPG